MTEPASTAPAQLTATVQSSTPPRVQLVATNITDVAAGLLTNPSFEGGFTGWTQPAAAGVTRNIRPEDAADPTAVLPPADGDRYAHASVANAATEWKLLRQEVAIPAVGDFYARVQTTGTTGQGRIRLIPMIGAVEQTDLVVTDTLDLDPTIWQQLATPTVGVDATIDRIAVELRGIGSTAGGTFEVGFDAAQIVQSGTEPGTITITRTAEGDTVPVRGALEVVPRTDTFVVVDNEAPFGVPLVYTLTQTYADGTTSTVESNEVILTGVELPWLTNPITGEGVDATIADWPELSYPGRQTIVDVSGRSAPLVISDVRGTPTSELVVLTRTRDQLVRLRHLLHTGDVVQVRPVCGAVEAAYLAVGEVTETRYRPAGDGAGSDWRRLVTLAAQAVDQPTPRIPAVGDTLADLAAYVPTTLADLATAFGEDATLLTIAQTHVGGDL